MDQIAAQQQMLNNQFMMMQMGGFGQMNPYAQQGSFFQNPYATQPGQFPTWRGNLPDSTVGQHGWLFQQDTKGYGVDLNGNGRYDRGRDGVIAFDMNRDGRIDANEVKASNERLKAFGGNYDLNGDGKVNFCERIQGQGMQRQMQGLDHDRDGRLNAWELAQGGGRVCVDNNQDGKFQQWEAYSPFRFPTGGFGGGSIGYVDPRFNTTQVNQNGWFRQPWAY